MRNRDVLYYVMTDELFSNFTNCFLLCSTLNPLTARPFLCKFSLKREFTQFAIFQNLQELQECVNMKVVRKSKYFSNIWRFILIFMTK